MTALKPIEYIFAGGLREDYCIGADGEVRLREIGGNALYAAVGARIWTEHVGLLARVGSNYPPEWLKQLNERGFDTRGIKVLDTPQDTRTFYAYLSLEERDDTNPAEHFRRIGQPLPEALSGYVSSTNGQEERRRFGPLAVRPSETPRSYLHARGAHLAPCEYVVHQTLPATLRRNGVRFITCDPSVRYMQPSFSEEVKQVVNGLDAFLPSEMEVRAFFGAGLKDLWQAAEAFGALGARLVVIKLGARGQYVYETATRRKWHVPAYPARVRDVTGAGDAYCGGFLVGLAETEDPVQAALRGTVSASLVVEGVGALYALDSATGLAQARLESLRHSVRIV
ncbi:MAG: carbohydrate kinase family protein [Anaerolineales bacterium]|nr:carbohydrate kinase family protein [Anaerolineales bacterium]